MVKQEEIEQELEVKEGEMDEGIMVKQEEIEQEVKEVDIKPELVEQGPAHDQ